MKKILSAAFMLALVSCAGNMQRLKIASEQRDCVGVGPQKCLLVQRQGNDTWEFRYQGIEGFEYVPGYEYVLKVKETDVENPPADASSKRYELIKVVSKEEKQSENLPPR